MTTITIPRALLEQALEALEACYATEYDGAKIYAAKLALRAALAAPAAVPEKCGHCGRRTIDSPWPIKPSTDDRHAQELLAQDITIANMEARHAEELAAYELTVANLRAERDAAMKDAERYRYLCGQPHWSEALEKAIDAAIAKAEGGAA